MNSETLSKEEVDEKYWVLLQQVEQCFRKMRYNHVVPIDLFYQMAHDLVLLSDQLGILDQLQKVRRHKEYTYNHCLNVAIITGVLAKWLNFGQKEQLRAVLGGLMHDIGKSQVMLEIINKPGPLNSEERTIMKQHTIRGYQLAQESGVDESILACILQHHERFDGSGYPLGIEGNKIHPHARVVAIADIYDAITSDRVYDEKRSTLVAVQELAQEMFGKLDSNGCATFLDNVQKYLLGHKVILTTGEEAEVVYVKPTFLEKPIVRSASGEYIDLEVRHDIEVKK